MTLFINKEILVKVGIRKDVAVSVNKESINKISSKNVISKVLVFHFTTPFSGCLQRRV